MSVREGPSPWTLEVTDLKQWAHCPRIVFYRYVLPRVRPTTKLMAEGQARHKVESGHEERRSLRPYGATEGERFFDVPLYDARLGLRGRADMVIATPTRATPGATLIVVEYKLTDRSALRNWKLQLAAYALLLEAVWTMPVVEGYVYQIGERQAQRIPLTAALRGQVLSAVIQINRLIQGEQLPPAPRNGAICVSCEFRRFCNDVV